MNNLGYFIWVDPANLDTLPTAILVTNMGIDIIDHAVLHVVGVLQRAYTTITFGGTINSAGITITMIAQKRIVGILLVHHLGEERQLEKR
jgi:ABC-type lipopolysaccharide export system ATPase subunit